MNIQETVKSVLQKGLSPMLSETKLQKRYAIFHRILPSQMQWFDEFLALIDRMPLTDVAITFDDGMHSSYQAIRKLKNRKAMFFVCPEYINRAETSRWQEFFYSNFLYRDDYINSELSEAVRPCSWEELRELVAMGHTIGSHTTSHARLSSISSQKELEREIIGSAEMIEDKLQIKVDTIAYPFGNIKSINTRAISLIEKRYTHCFSGIRGNNYGTDEGFLQWRDAINSPRSLEYARFLLRGGFDWYYGMQRRKLRNMTRGMR